MTEHVDRVGDYEIEATIGSGGMATVYRARHVFLDTHHAIKVLDPRYRVQPEARRRFLDEAKIQAKHLDHPNIVKVTNIVATADHAALVMELIEGSTLEAELGTLRRYPDELKRIMYGVLDAVGHAHAAGIVHRDLKPANVLLQRKGGALVPKVTDFGIAKVSAAVAGEGKKSTHGDTRMGTLSYMSPEQIRRAKDVTARSDIFSLGAMLYELATGEVAFAGDSDYDVMESIVNGRYEPPERKVEGLDPVLASVIKRALEADPAKRFASCEEMAAALRGDAKPAARAEPAPSPSASASSSAPSATSSSAKSTFSSATTSSSPAPSSGRTGLVIGLVTVGLGLGAVAVVLATRGGDTARTAGTPALDAAAPDVLAAATVDIPDAAEAIADIDAAPEPDVALAAAPVAPPTCPEDMALLEGNAPWMGPDGNDGKAVTIAPFCIDRTEVMAGLYADCATCTSGRGRLCNPAHASRRGHPANCVNLADAVHYCETVGKRLPTEAEWERAAAGLDRREFPWGSASPSNKHLNWWNNKKYSNTSPVAILPEGATPDGVSDLAGNVAEWVADEFAPYVAGAYPTAGAITTDRPDAKKTFVVRGGSWRSRSRSQIRTTARAAQKPTARTDNVGFRCALSPGGAAPPAPVPLPAWAQPK